MLKIFITLALFISTSLRAQHDQNLEKIILVNGNIYRFSNALDKTNFFTLTKISPVSTDTLYQYAVRREGFELNPLCWDVISSKFINLKLYTDSHKEPFANLCYYEVDSLMRLFKKDDARLHSYLFNRYRSLSSIIPPLDIYKYRFDYVEDTIHRNPHLDFTCSKDLFLFYFYLPNKKTLEKWQYTPFSRALGFTTVKDSVHQQAWIKQKEYNIDLSGPFRTFAANHKNYLITEDGRTMLVLADSIKEMGRIADLEQKVLVFDKDRNQLRTIRKKSLESIKGPLSPEAIYRKSRVVIDFNR